MISVFYLYAPETRGKTFEEMDFYFATEFGAQAILDAIQTHRRGTQKDSATEVEVSEKRAVSE
ncbi:hypothetical protein NEOLEDRAFT_1140567 [Neolentinus lepideus HHB14362 ss-1]|uniref:Uncharacterized protein n=1 Tax=Neolentinus lepideus HHB14362 ss-1 TaxID=1314782 RepID=A0A165P6H5_9AGAM|nr:hypothetical protein NEOLEDRAFT_1140567 [Neolentinus lepideus HHB14362 ss-1]